MQFITRKELLQAQLALFVAITLQVVVWSINDDLLLGPQYVIIPTEIILAFLIIFAANKHKAHQLGLNKLFTYGLLTLISLANASSLLIVLHSLVIGHSEVSGPELLGSAIAIFITNVIIFAFWYWEIDSPALSRTRWSKHDKDFQFPQQDPDMAKEFPTWKSQFLDYLYLALTNAINFAPADTKPLTPAAKMLMGIQALISVFTIALVIARSVSILG